MTPVVIGAAISDSAVLTGATSDAGGSISFKLYSNDTCTTLVTTLGPVSVSGNGTYPSGSYTPSAVGTYYWVASYIGDVKNESVSGGCKDIGETSVVNKAPADIATAQSFYPQDSVTMSASAGGTPTGTVTFKLFGPKRRTAPELPPTPGPASPSSVGRRTPTTSRRSPSTR